MPRVARHAPGGFICHVLNRAAGRTTLFRHADDYLAFLRVFRHVRDELDMPVLGFCLMPNHWHLVLRPRRDGDLARFMQKLTITHVRRWVEHRQRVGCGSVYQGRYKSFPTQDDHHFLTVMRYVERNPLRAKLVRKAGNWRWSSLGQPATPARTASANSTRSPGDDHPEWPTIPLASWPVARPDDWPEVVNTPQTKSEAEAVARSIRHSRPLGDAGWTARTERRFGLGPLRPRGRPPKQKTEKR